jgi:N utilization substance protein B
LAKPDHPLSKRKAARVAAVQALYQMELTSADPRSIVAEFKDHRLDSLLEPLEMTSPEVDAEHFSSLILGVGSHVEELDAQIGEHLVDGWTLARCGYLLRACLRAGAFELGQRADIPPKVVISEYVQISEMFQGTSQARLVNAVLDRLARQRRPELFQ